jgi:acyl-CoA thioester hydrolase
MEHTLAAFPVRSEIPVLWSDQDTFAHVNNIAYLRWCEEGRIQYLRRIELYPEGAPQGIGPIVASVTCHYRAPVNYPDTVVVGSRVVKIGTSSFRMEHGIMSRASAKIVAEAEAAIVTIDYATGKSVPVPETIRQAIARVERLNGSR